MPSVTLYPNPAVQYGQGVQITQDAAGPSRWVGVDKACGVDLLVISGTATVEQTAMTQNMLDAAVQAGAPWAQGTLPARTALYSDSILNASAVRLVVSAGGSAVLWVRN